MLSWQRQLLAWLGSGLLLGSVVWVLSREMLRDRGYSPGWLGLLPSFDGLILSEILLLLVLYAVVAVWVLLFVLWGVRKALHITSEDRTTYLK